MLRGGAGLQTLDRGFVVEFGTLTLFLTGRQGARDRAKLGALPPSGGGGHGGCRCGALLQESGLHGDGRGPLVRARSCRFGRLLGLRLRGEVLGAHIAELHQDPPHVGVAEDELPVVDHAADAVGEQHAGEGVHLPLIPEGDGVPDNPLVEDVRMRAVQARDRLIDAHAGAEALLGTGAELLCQMAPGTLHLRVAQPRTARGTRRTHITLLAKKAHALLPFPIRTGRTPAGTKSPAQSGRHNHLGLNRLPSPL